MISFNVLLILSFILSAKIVYSQDDELLVAKLSYFNAKKVSKFNFYFLFKQNLMNFFFNKCR